MSGRTIAIDARLWPELAGGVAQWVIGIASALSRLQDGDEEYLFLVPEDGADWLEGYVSSPARIIGLPRSPMARIGEFMPALRPTWRRLRRSSGGTPSLLGYDAKLRSWDVDVIHFPFQQAFDTSVPSIYQPWDLQHLHLPDLFTRNEIDQREESYRRFVRQAAVVLVASEWTRQDLIEKYGVDRSQVAVVNVPPIVSFYPDVSSSAAAQVVSSFSIPGDYLLYPAQTYPHKNHVRLLEAVARAAEQGVCVNLVCSGRQTSDYSGIEQQIERLGLRQQVHFVGFVEPLELQALYRLARGLIFPSLFEGWGLPIFEGFTHGLPIACSDVTNLPALVGDAAIVFDPRSVEQISNAMITLWTDEARRQELAARGRRRASQFDWDRTGRLLRAHYRRVAGTELTAADLDLLTQPPLV